MYIKKERDLQRMIDAALGRVPCDLTIQNVRVVNTAVQETYSANVDICGGFIVNVRAAQNASSPQSRTVYDGQSRYLLPGFIDTHTHVECSFLTPENYGRAVAPWGTTCVVTDPHEIANVMGVKGVREMLKSAAKSPIRQFFLAPSCVPAVPEVETAGTCFEASEIATLLQEPSCLGLAELMDYDGIRNGNKRMLSILREGLLKAGFLQGHAPGLSGDALAAYCACGIQSDHEITSVENLCEKLRAGMWIDVRESSMSDGVPQAIAAMKLLPQADRFVLCTDGTHAAEILEKGHINHVAARLIQEGALDPIKVIRMGTSNAAQAYHLKDIGLVAPGYLADLQLVEDLFCLDKTPPAAVFVGGELIAEHGALLLPEREADWPEQETVVLPQMRSVKDFCLSAPPSAGPFVKALLFDARRSAQSSDQARQYISLPVADGFVKLPPDADDLHFLCIMNRYGNGNTTTVVATGTGLREGAFASTVSHDSHNLIVVYKDPEDAFLAASALRKSGGGLCVVRDHQVEALLPLPIAGLMHPAPAETVAPMIRRMNEAVLQICGRLPKERNPLLRISAVALPAWPGIIVTDKGIIDNATGEFVPLFLSES